MTRRNGKLYTTVSAEVTGKDSTAISREVQEEVDGLDLPAGSTVEFGGITEQINESFTQLGLAMLAVFAALAWAGQAIAGLGAVAGWSWFALLFVGGWILQLVGHVFEGRKPALADNLFQIFVAPIFLAAEVFFALGYKPQLHQRVLQLSRAQRAESSSSLPRTSSMIPLKLLLWPPSAP